MVGTRARRWCTPHSRGGIGQRLVSAGNGEYQIHDLGSFDELVRAVQERARGGEMFFSMDVKPSFQDTPEDWEDRLESAFSTALRE